jgi:hypothetical protein
MAEHISESPKFLSFLDWPTMFIALTVIVGSYYIRKKRSPPLPTVSVAFRHRLLGRLGRKALLLYCTLSLTGMADPLYMIIQNVSLHTVE